MKRSTAAACSASPTSCWPSSSCFACTGSSRQRTRRRRCGGRWFPRPTSGSPRGRRFLTSVPATRTCWPVRSSKSPPTSVARCRLKRSCTSRRPIASLSTSGSRCVWRMKSTRKFRCVLTGDNGGGILQNMTYRIVAGDATTPEYKIRVIQPPAATIESIRLDIPRIHAPRAGRADDGRDRRAGGDARHAQGSLQHAPTLSGVAAVLRRRNGLEAGRRNPDPRHRRDEARGRVEARDPRRHVSALLSHFLHEHGGRVRPQPESLQPGHSARSAARNPPPRSHDRSGAAGQRRFAACHRSPRSRLCPALHRSQHREGRLPGQRADDLQ